LSKIISNELAGMIERIQMMTNQEVKRLTPEVEKLINSRSQDNHHIETILDQLLDCAGMSSDAIELFKHLCRYCYMQNPAAVVDYIRIYHDLYGENSEQDNSKTNDDA